MANISKNYVTHVFFADFFKDLLAASKRGFHEMFKKTYGILYEQNAFVFTDFFNELEKYYLKGTVSIPLFLFFFFFKNLNFTKLNNSKIKYKI